MEYFEDPSFLEKHKRNFYSYGKGKFEYEILGVDLVDPNTPLYELSSNRNNDLEAMKKELKKHISASKWIKLTKIQNFLMLVTCKHANDNSSRRILFAKLKNS